MINQPCTILLVDDEPAGRATLKGMLVDQGYNLIYASNGLEAVEMAQQFNPDLILLDVMMPGMDGFEACQKIRTNEQLAEVPIIMVTALDDLHSYLKAIEVGADDCVSKPFDRVRLRARIRTLTKLNRYRRLHQSEEKVREQAALLDIAQNAIIVCDLEENILFWNKSAERIYGWTAAEAREKKANEFLYDSNSPEISTARISTLEYGAWVGDLQQKTKDKKSIIVANHWTLVFDGQQAPKSIFMVNTDITEKKELEEKYLRTQRMESLGSLASGIAHDLNNMLSPIMMGVSLLGKQLSDERSQRLLDMMESSVHRGADLVNQVLMFSRGAEGKRINLRLNSIINELEKMVQQTFPKSIRIKTSFARNLWPSVGHPTQIYQVLINLCVNARDAMPNGGIITVEATNEVIDNHYAQMKVEAVPGKFVCLTVSDTGTGIPQEIIKKIFDPFFTTKDIGKGTGLGLSTSIDIAKSHGGFIDVYSEPNKGTTFKVYLSASTPEQTLLETPLLRTQKGGHEELILVVDDDSSIREITKLTLEAYGYKVLLANDGTEAIYIYTKNLEKISLVLIDIMMPNLGGQEAIKVLQIIKPNLKIISMSGIVNNKLAPDIHIKAFLTKPYSADKLLETITQVLNSE